MPTHLASLRISWTGLAECAGLLAMLGTLAGAMGRWSWILDLGAHFPAQYAAVLAVSVGILSASRHWRTAAVFLIPLVWNLALVGFQGWGSRPEAHSSSATPVTAVVFNLNSQNRKLDRVHAWLDSMRPDVVVLLEVQSSGWDRLRPLSARYPHQVVETRENNFGIVVLSRFALHDSDVRIFAVSDVPTVLVTLETAVGPVRLVATHPVPPVGPAAFQARNAQLEAIARNVATTPLPTVVLGDLNTTPWSASFRHFVRDSGLVDSGRGRGWQPTWPGRWARLGIPIDHALASPDVAVLGRKVGPDLGSDHRPLWLRLGIPPRNPTQPRW